MSVGPDNVFCIASCYGLGGLGIDFRWKRHCLHPTLSTTEIFYTRPDPAWGPPNLLYKGYRVSFPGLKPPKCSYQLASSREVKERV